MNYTSYDSKLFMNYRFFLIHNSKLTHSLIQTYFINNTHSDPDILHESHILSVRHNYAVHI